MHELVCGFESFTLAYMKINSIQYADIKCKAAAVEGFLISCWVPKSASMFGFTDFLVYIAGLGLIAKRQWLDAIFIDHIKLLHPKSQLCAHLHGSRY